jgi:indolepyruvate ferredoxin oxidoreductase beta subunit
MANSTKKNTTKKPVGKKAPAKKTVKSATKKSPAKKAATKKTAKSAVKKAPSKKVAAVKKSLVQKTPVKKVSAKKAANDTKNIMIVGVGGQGTLLTSRILGGIMRAAGYDVKLSEVHGMAQRGGSVVTFVRYGKKVAEPIVEEGQADVLISFERLEALRYAHFLKKTGVIVVNDERIDPMTVVTGAASYPEGILEGLKKSYTVYSIDAMSEALNLGSARCFNVIVLGMAAKHMEFTKEQWLKVIEETVPAKTVDMNKQAFLLGYEGK